jgi:hypothetical protein
MISTIAQLESVLATTKLYVGTLNIGTRRGRTDYIDFLTQEDMTLDSIKRFTDVYRRPGIAFNLVTKKEIDIGMTSGPLPAGYTSVLAIFQRYTDMTSTSFGWGGSDCNMEHAINKAHDLACHHEDIISTCHTCPIEGRRFRATALRDIITGKNEYVGLMNAHITGENEGISVKNVRGMAR